MTLSAPAFVDYDSIVETEDGGNDCDTTFVPYCGAVSMADSS